MNFLEACFRCVAFTEHSEMPFPWNFLTYQPTRHHYQEGRRRSACHSDDETCVSCRKEMYEDYSGCPNAVFVISCPTLVLILSKERYPATGRGGPRGSV